jgi:hypothetical protein
MALQTVLEKLQIKDEKNILVQGLPSSIEKQFIKLNFAKSVTPLLKSRRIDLALVFAISKSQLSEILKDVLPAMHSNGKLWIAYPKPTAKIASDLCRDCSWDCMTSIGFETGEMVSLDTTWSAVNFIKNELFEVSMATVRIADTLKSAISGKSDSNTMPNRIPTGKKIAEVAVLEPKSRMKRAAARS